MKVTGRVWRDASLQDTAPSLADAPTLLADSALLTWIDLAGPDEAAVVSLARALGVDSSAVEDVLNPRERVKMHRYAHHWFITAYTTRLADHAPSAHSYDSRLVLEKVSAFVLPHGLVTIHASGDFDPGEMASRWDDEPDELTLGVGALVHAFLDTVVDDQFTTMQALDDIIDDTEDIVFSGKLNQHTFPEQIHQLRTELTQMRRVVLPMREIVASIQRHRLLGTAGPAALPGPAAAPTAKQGDAGSWLEPRGPGEGAMPLPLQDVRPTEVHIAPELEPLFDDLYDHVLRAMEWTDSLRDLASSIFETNLSLQDARLNEVMKKLAGWAAVIAVPTAVTGWFGQNVPFWGMNATSGLIASVVLIVVLGGGVYGLLRHYGWI